MKISPVSLSKSDVAKIVNILNRGNQVEIKRENTNIVIVEIKRYVAEKITIVEAF